MSKKSHHFLTLWPWPLTYDLEKLIRSGHYHPGGVLPMWWVIHMCRGFDPLFSLWQDRARSFWGIFLIHQQQSYLLGYKNYQFLQKSIFLAPNSIFSSIFLGPIFSGQRHTPISFQAEYPPPRALSLPMCIPNLKFENNPSRGFWVLALTPLRAAGGFDVKP